MQMVLQIMEQIRSVILDLQHHQPLHSQLLVKPYPGPVLNLKDEIQLIVKQLKHHLIL